MKVYAGLVTLLDKQVVLIKTMSKERPIWGYDNDYM